MRNSISKTMVAGAGGAGDGGGRHSPDDPGVVGRLVGRRHLAWRRGGMEGAGQRLAGGWGSGWHGGGAWHPGYWRGGVWYNGWWGPAIAAGIAAGALATYPYWGGYGYGYPNNGCWAYRPTYDGYGNYLGQNWVSIC